MFVFCNSNPPMVSPILALIWLTCWCTKNEKFSFFQYIIQFFKKCFSIDYVECRNKYMVSYFHVMTFSASSFTMKNCSVVLWSGWYASWSSHMWLLRRSDVLSIVQMVNTFLKTEKNMIGIWFSGGRSVVSHL